MKLLFRLIPAILLLACSEPSAPAPQVTPGVSPVLSAETRPTEKPEPTLQQLEEELGIAVLAKPWTGDLDGMIERRVIRVLTVYGFGRYFLDGVQERGPVYELFKAWEKEINEQQQKKHVRIHVVFIPVARDELIPGLLAGRGDIAAAGLTITPERLQLVDFSDPITKPLSEILVTGPTAPPIKSLDDLAGQEIYVRASSSYRTSLDELNRRFRAEGKTEIALLDAPESLEDEDLLEMVQVGMLPWIVVDDYKAGAWGEAFPDLVPRKDLVLRQGGRLGYAFRKDSPLLRESIDAFVKNNRQGTLFGNMMVNRYFRDFDWPKNALAPKDYERFKHVIDIFKEYGEQYGMDYLLMVAQGYQESQLDQSRRSPAGAVGIMQLLPSTAADPNVGIPDIGSEDNNIHAGVKYLDFIRTQYFAGPELDLHNSTLFALASYNAGPARIRGLRQTAAQQGYDPNKWFDNVEIIAAREIGRETVQYVANILKYYSAYFLIVKRYEQRISEREDLGLSNPGQTDDSE